ncbi:GHKL domain-containing protein [Sporosarcina sp. E16_3]|uniref:ATP-binding protein n=1 Tax=Sporosarcina sp. E16_3 TaxID=2789293 RepID=UPI001A9276A1|nr:ATP-binding protein [Sporosarcina sp. E16_3]MBO0603592.1 GHKL domain-containing protein [Sporosarcina sp. E16_3]
MGSRYNDQFRIGNVGNAYDHDIGNDPLQEASKSFLTNDKIKLVEKLAAGVAHEIRNPLTSIKGFVQLLNMGLSKPEYYSMIYSEINKVDEIVNKLIRLAETQSVNFRLNDIGLILERTIMRMNDLALLKGIKIILSLEGDLFSICCDEVQLQQVFENIIKNAIEASACNKKMYITCKTNESHVHIMIKDQGIGITDERIVHLFEPFYCTKESGTGFGLMISHKIIKEHNGTIQVKSELEIGTTVDIYLPLLNS